MTRYTSATDADRAEMLAAIGVDSTADLFEQIPEPLRLGRALELPDGLSEAEVYERLAALADRNADAEEQVCFVGAGMYDHYVPAIVDAITQRSEFLTPYTPYQPEISQGGLQAMFEFQTAMSELTGLPVSNAGLYEGPSAVASAAYLAMGATKRRRFVVSARRPPAQPRDARHLLGRLRRRGRARSASRAASPTPPRWPPRSTTRPPPSSCRAPTSSARSRTSRRSAPRPRSTGRCSSSPSTR